MIRIAKPKFLTSFVFVGVATLGLVVATPLALFAQREARVRSLPGEGVRGLPAGELTVTPLLVNRSGGSDDRPGDVTPPRDLPADQKASIAGSLGLSLWHGDGPWLLTPASPVAPGRARRGFREAEHVSAGSADYPASARIYGRRTYGMPGQVSLSVTATAPGERYLIDCKVSPTGSRGLQFSGPGNSATFTNTEHLIAIYEAPDTAPASFSIRRPTQTDSYTSDSFSFYSCEITKLQ